MLVSVRFQPGGDKDKPFLLTVTGANHQGDFQDRFATMDAVWHAALEVGYDERDWLTEDGPGWNKCPACDGKGVMDAPLGVEHQVCLECGGGS